MSNSYEEKIKKARLAVIEARIKRRIAKLEKCRIKRLPHLNKKDSRFMRNAQRKLENFQTYINQRCLTFAPVIERFYALEEKYCGRCAYQTDGVPDCGVLAEDIFDILKDRVQCPFINFRYFCILADVFDSLEENKKKQKARASNVSQN